MTVAARKHVHEFGGSSSAVQYHYDVGTDFYRLWLDDTLTYSCALWDAGNPRQTLSEAQKAKYDWHLKTANAAKASSLLDIGFGWGGLLTRASQLENLDALTGLTLSKDQLAHVSALDLRATSLRLENWADHVPTANYDSIISIGALEHFTRPEDSEAEKIAVYRTFFHRCDSWLNRGGKLSLQTIAYGDMDAEDASAFINNEIFPSADLPRLSELARAADRVLEITEVQNHRLHYARTFEAWAKNLSKRRREACDMVGEEITERYIKYLTQSSLGFYMGKIQLLRLGLSKS